MRQTLLAATLILAAAALVSAQGPPLPGQGGPGEPGAGPPPHLVIQEVLGLSDDQVVALHGLLDARRQAMEQLQPQLADTERALHDAIHAPDPDPTAIGGLVLQLEVLHDEVRAVEAAFRDGFLDLLDDEQRGRLEHIRGTELALRAAQALHALGL